MAQAGLGVSAESLNASPQFIEASATDQRAALIELAGVTGHARGSTGAHNAHNAQHAQHANNAHTGHTGHKGKKGKPHTYLPTAGVDFVFSSHGNVHNQQCTKLLWVITQQKSFLYTTHWIQLLPSFHQSSANSSIMLLFL